MVSTQRIPKGYKKTEQALLTGRVCLPGLDGQWKQMVLGDHVKFLKTGSYSRAQLISNGQVKYLHYGDIHAATTVWLDARETPMPCISEEQAANLDLLQSGDLVFVDASEDLEGVGKSLEITNVPEGGLVAGLHTIAARFDKSVLADGFKGYLQFVPDFRKQLLRFAAGTKVYAIQRSHIAAIELKLPGIDEQRAIAAALADVDGLLAALDALIAKKRAVKTAAMQQLLTGKTRLPGFADKQGYKRTEVGEIPEDWDVKSLSKLGSFCKGKGIKRDDVIANGAIPCVRYGEIYTHYENCVTNPVSRVSEVVAAAAQPIDYGDLLFAGSGETADEIGKCVAYLGPTPAVAGGDIVVLRPQGLDPLFSGYLLNHEIVTKQKSRFGQGDAVVHINSNNLGKVLIPLPSLPEQRAIAAVLSDMDAEITALEARREKVRQIKQGMMQVLLTGKVRLV